MDILISVVSTFVVTTFLIWMIFRYELKNQRRELENRSQKRVENLLRDRGEAMQILAAIDLGVIYYSSGGELRIVNDAARELLGEVPQDYHKFLDSYGEINDMGLNLALGKETADAILPLGERMVYVRLRIFSSEGYSGHIAMLRDVTRQFGEEKQRKEYVSNVSHELRTPLTTIKTYSESLIDWGVAEKQKDAIIKDISKIYEDSIRMERLIDDLYLLSSVDENSISRSMHVEALDLVWITKNLSERMQAQAEARKMLLDCSAPAQLPRVYGDRNQIERVVGNLISNAIKYGREAGEIHVYLGYLRDEIYIKVKDNGVGIEPAHQQHIFERFYRVDDSRSRQLGGRGLGLAIVKELVELHEGTITVESQLAHGSEFTVLLPTAEKRLRQTLYELEHDGGSGGPIARAAEHDLEQLAASLGIVAKWKSLNPKQYQAIMAGLKNASAGVHD